MNSPFFSIVIPTYNNKKLLEKAIKSVFSQTYKNFEIIIIDNYSKDETENWVNSLKDIRIKFKKNHNHGLIGRSRNLGIKLSSAKWIAFLDADDIWYENRLESIYNIIIKNNNFDVICNDEIFVKNEVKKLWKAGPYKKNFYKNLIKFGNCISTSATIINKDFLEKNNTYFSDNIKFSPYEDFEFWMRIAMLEARFKFTGYAHGEHLFHSSSYSAQDKLACKNSLISIFKHHVFTLQSFTEKKEELWRHVESRMAIDEIVELFILKKYIKSIKLMFCISLKYPVKSIINIFYKLTS